MMKIIRNNYPVYSKWYDEMSIIYNYIVCAREKKKEKKMMKIIRNNYPVYSKWYDEMNIIYNYIKLNEVLVIS